MGEKLNDAIRETKTLHVYGLAYRADCYAPDSETSEGAQFLAAVRDAVVEVAETDTDLLVQMYRDNEGGVIVDAVVPVYTHPRMVAFVDLGAYREDVAELGYEGVDAVEQAGAALYMVGERLAYALVEELATTYLSENPDE